jgi:predicted RNase H-like HicB family nuclease
MERRETIMKYAYPVRISPQDDGYYLATAFDLPGVVVGGANLPEVLQAASDGCAMWLADAENERESIPAPSIPNDIPLESVGEFVSMVLADTNEYRQKNDTRAVKKTLSLPAWMADQAEQSGLSLSQVLQEALRERMA